MQIAAMNVYTRELKYAEFFLNGCKHKGRGGTGIPSNINHKEPWEQIRENFNMLDDKIGITEYYCPCYKLGYRVLATKVSDHYEKRQGETTRRPVTSFKFDFLSVINRTGRPLIESSDRRYSYDEHDGGDWLDRHVDKIIEAGKRIKSRLPLLSALISHISIHSYESYHSWASEVYRQIEEQIDEEDRTYNLEAYNQEYSGIRDNIFLRLHKINDIFNPNYPVLIFHLKPELFDPDLPAGFLLLPYIAMDLRYEHFDHEFTSAFHIGEFEPNVREKIDHMNEHLDEHLDLSHNNVRGERIHNNLINTYLSGFVSSIYMLQRDYLPIGEKNQGWIDDLVTRLNRQFKTKIFQTKELDPVAHLSFNSDS